MRSDDLLRARLDDTANRAAPLRVTTDQVRSRVKRRRRLVAAGTGIASIAVISAVAFAVGGLTGGTPLMVATPGPSYSPRPQQPPALFICGAPYDVPDSPTVDALTVTVTSQKVSDQAAPALTATFETTRQVFVAAGRPSGMQVLYLKDGIIVGGGPMLNQPGDTRGQGVDPVREGFDVAPGSPHVQNLGPRTTLCGSQTWPEVWSSAGEYDVALVLGPVDVDAHELRFQVPSSARAENLIVTRARLSPAD
ncbi:hypothetical protein DFJ67_5630 [Asanoa ferruginea]|uniref:Uncharacterized protein n=1 Tax=Asanoa ferruginea TaxID=53367 RepID=A0A3D9ZQR2_9ACTN|nr:hypothetical protein [Asanoa ferruginea]REF99591.1 hypothetical protein DFJ67_5630 [Asanoa ferruginea]GIF53488.1 hypothetical protein Afe04nite_80270 [Asanoa ferruginea]